MMKGQQMKTNWVQHFQNTAKDVIASEQAVISTSLLNDQVPPGPTYPQLTAEMNEDERRDVWHVINTLAAQETNDLLTRVMAA